MRKLFYLGEKKSSYEFPLTLQETAILRTRISLGHFKGLHTGPTFFTRDLRYCVLTFKSALVDGCGLQVEWAMQRTCLDLASPCIFGDWWTLLQLCCQEVPGPSLKGKKTTCRTSCISVWSGAGCGTSSSFWRSTQELTLSTLGR